MDAANDSPKPEQSRRRNGWKIATIILAIFLVLTICCSVGGLLIWTFAPDAGSTFQTTKEPHRENLRIGEAGRVAEDYEVTVTSVEKGKHEGLILPDLETGNDKDYSKEDLTKVVVEVHNTSNKTIPDYSSNSSYTEVGSFFAESGNGYSRSPVYDPFIQDAMPLSLSPGETVEKTLYFEGVDNTSISYTTTSYSTFSMQEYTFTWDIDQ